MKPPRSKLRGITKKGIVCETPRFLTLFPLQGNLGASSEESPELKNKGFKEESRTKFGVDAIGMSTTLESHQSPAGKRQGLCPPAPPSGEHTVMPFRYTP